MRKRTSQIGLLLLITLACAEGPVARAEKLPFKIYTTADGLAHDSVNKIVRDSRGFLWFCTEDGLSRFNGYSFKTYTQEQGLPSRNVIDLLETKDGTYLIATKGGLVVFDPWGKAYRWNVIEGRLEQNSSEPPMFRTYSFPDDPNNRETKAILALAQREDGTIYAGTNHGLFRFNPSSDGGGFSPVESDYFRGKILGFGGLLVDSRNGLWLVTSGGIFRLTGDETITPVSDIGGREIYEDREGRIWIGSSGIALGLRLFTFQGDVPQLIQTFTTKDGLQEERFNRVVAETEDGRIFIRSKGQVGEYLPNARADEPKFRYFDSELVETGGVDSGGNVWFGTLGKGAWKLASNGFTSYGPEAGLPSQDIHSMWLTRDGALFTVYQDDKVNQLVDGKIKSVIPLGFKSRSWGSTNLDLRASDGEWWLPSEQGLFRYPAVAPDALGKTPPEKIFTIKDGLADNTVFNIFEDAHRDIWMSVMNGDAALNRWERSTDKIIRYTLADGIKPNNGLATAFVDDAAGNFWLGFYFGGVMRYRNGSFRQFSAIDGIPEGYVSDLLSDAKGRLWIATLARGVFRVDDPNAETPKFTNISMAQGLLSNQTNCLACDKFGRIYVGTGRGLNRIDPETETVRAYSQADGLPGNFVSQCRTDKNGVLWVAGANSVARFVPGLEKPSVPPPVFVDGISVNGSPRKISELGETKIDKLDLAADQRQIQIDFFALGFDSGDILRYQYKLNDQPWSTASDQRSVALNLSAGTYKFTVRAITADGVTSTEPATVLFTIARPVWQRWWFLTLAALLIGSGLLALDRYRAAKAKQLQRAREERIAELQRVRARIATDLHDDIGSSLSQISVYSELARQRENENGKAGEPLNLITIVSNELVDTMSDIVWAINPRKDHLQDLTQRMRRFAADVLSAKDIDLEFHSPDPEHDIPLGANIRREIFLIFKETVNNIVKHSEAKTATIDFSLLEHQLEISFHDDGKGLSPAVEPESSGAQEWKRFRGGNGLLNMKKRAMELGGSYNIDSTPGEGTKIILRVPFEVAKNAN